MAAEKDSSMGAAFGFAGLTADLPIHSADPAACVGRRFRWNSSGRRTASVELEQAYGGIFGAVVSMP